MRVLDIFNVSRTEVVEHTTEESTMPEIQEAVNPTDQVTMDIPLLLRIMEYSTEDAKTDMDLHHVVERLIELSASGKTLTMANYNDIMSSLNEMGGSEAEELVKAISVDSEDEQKPEDTIKKFVKQMPNGVTVTRYKIFGPNGMTATDSVFNDRASALKHLRTFFNQDVKEGHGRYWCSTDKRWKERQGPKQSRG